MSFPLGVIPAPAKCTWCHARFDLDTELLGTQCKRWIGTTDRSGTRLVRCGGTLVPSPFTAEALGALRTRSWSPGRSVTPTHPNDLHVVIHG